MERLGPGNSGFSPRPLDRSDAGFNGNLKNPDSGLHLLRFWRVKDGRLGAYGELSRSSCHGNIKVSGIKAAPIEYDCYVGFESRVNHSPQGGVSPTGPRKARPDDRLRRNPPLCRGERRITLRNSALRAAPV
jgi:hypothetical protein